MNIKKCVDSIEAIPEEERGYELTVLLGRAYSNLGVLGDNNSKANEDGVDIFLLEKAVNIFESVRCKGWMTGIGTAVWLTPVDDGGTRAGSAGLCTQMAAVKT